MADFYYNLGEESFNSFLDNFENYEISTTVEEKKKYLKSAEKDLLSAKRDYRQSTASNVKAKVAVCKNRLVEVKKLLSEIQESQEQEYATFCKNGNDINLVYRFAKCICQHPSSLEECESLLNDLRKLQVEFKDLNECGDADVYVEKCSQKIIMVNQMANSIKNDVVQKNKLAWQMVIAFGILYLIISAFVHSVVALIIVVIVGIVGAMTLYFSWIEKNSQYADWCSLVLTLEVHIISVFTAFNNISVIAGIGVIIAPALALWLMAIIFKS